ncbi:transcription factor LHW isoform X1 [Amborella trichopoda]|uniref:BHLH domain-containing protein n=1 Tax=Amborella trichopoda TaxID=13333 RepID=W1PJX7_AMBTC|nr:transcription factor LHW isoform X1 [Amborella trichopoda]ERN08039.1 hypothetical protein AMTR_s00012p00261730 [Amborella trichopoda]|eukprot:XP_006846364.1 transcription factor LHW isoform X1 [Amborella trichopoda]
METPLRQLLKGFCHDSEWQYAVFWKLKHRSRMLLTWEDGYYNFPKPPCNIQDTTTNAFFNSIGGADYSSDAIDGRVRHSVRDPIGAAVANMSYLVYALGEGIIGQVAFSGRHYWAFAEKVFNGEGNSQFVPEYPSEWQFQFAAGIKTIVLIPVVPHGVVQLGSLKLLMEDLKLVDHVKSSFNMLQNKAGAFFPDPVHCSSNKNNPDPVSSSFDSISQNSFASSAIYPSISRGIQAENLVENSAAPLVSNSFTYFLNQVVKSELTSFQIHHKPLNDFQDLILGEEMGHLAMRQKPVEELPDQNIYEDSLFNFCGQSDSNIMQGSSLSSLTQVVDQDSLLKQSMRSASCKDQEQNGEDYLWALSFPAESELHKVLKPVFSNMGSTDAASTDSSTQTATMSELIEPLVGEFDAWLRSEGSSEHLLDAVVANALSTGAQSCNSSSTLLGGSCLTESNGGGSGSIADDSISDPWSGYLGFVQGSRGTSVRSPSGLSSKAMSTMVEGERKEVFSCSHSKKLIEPSKLTKRRAKPGESCRPRPRDRQQIQDRVKELREIVPNGAKCSIDALLERTIKHMIFLRNVTSHADKLKLCSKVADNKQRPLLVGRSNSDQRGASWALDLGSQTGVCPVVVENLDHPGHMLVEMLCEEDGLFLEIAQVIRNLGLTIIKGLMEARADKFWAHFVVEGPRGIQRMDVLWQLMQLLQPKSPSTQLQANVLHVM